MRTAGLIAEFNPLHNGHKHLIDTIKKENDAVVCIMSGSFTQRGHVALCSKWARAKAALSCGVDLVIELPVVYAVNTAQKFAYGGVFLLNALHIADSLYFGSECGDIAMLRHAAELLDNEPADLSVKIKAYMGEGMSFPAARTKAFSKLLPSPLLSSPNNILAIEYLRALSQLNSSINAFTIPRLSVGHHDAVPTGNIASASAIRAMLKNGQSVKPYLPAASYEILQQEIACGRAPYRQEHLTRPLIHTLRASDATALRRINDIGEGLENRIMTAYRTGASFEEIVDAIKTKRYTRTRIDRILTSILLGLTHELSKQTPSYIRVLGFSSIGRQLLQHIKKNSVLPIITKLAAIQNPPDMLQKDILASDTARLCLDDLSAQSSGSDYTTSPILFF